MSERKQFPKYNSNNNPQQELNPVLNHVQVCTVGYNSFNSVMSFRVVETFFSLGLGPVRGVLGDTLGGVRVQRVTSGLQRFWRNFFAAPVHHAVGRPFFRDCGRRRQQPLPNFPRRKIPQGEGRGK